MRLLSAIAAGCAFVVAGCGSDPQGSTGFYVDGDPPLGYNLTRAIVTISLNDYQGQYELIANQYTTFSDRTVILNGDAFSDGGWLHIDEDGDLLSLALAATGEIDADLEAPHFTYAQSAYFAEFDCRVDLDGSVYPWTLPEYDAPKFSYRGPITLTCLGETIEMETDTFYNEPGVLVGSVGASFDYEVDTAQSSP